ncbi:hypothetical protein [Pseudoxanthomonas sangjuensis]|uniref:hypothetical protein n=1 Tax=Pseudoxanthomonas sangjuensis TaxID=1503750 RepID=UPI0013920CE3|nr:hypothetical protein [Pseudoxanthomonas sangjuensis]
MTARNALPRVCLAVLIAIVLAVILAIASSWLLQWNTPGDLLFDQGLVQSLALGVLPTAAVIVNLLIASYRAAERHAWAWLAASLIIWPLSFWYTIVEARGER